MVIRKDRRTKPFFRINAETKERTVVKEYSGIPVLHEYKYLGVLIDDCGQFAIAVKKQKSKERQLMYQVKMSWSQEMPGKARYIIW